MNATILLADDHAILRDGLRTIIESQAGFKVIGEASTGRDAVNLTVQLCPDVVVMDIGMPDLNGVEATRQIVAADPRVKVIALSTFGDRQFVLAMLEAGAWAYVLKAAASEELLRAVRAVLANQKYLCAKVAGLVVDSYNARQFASNHSAAAILTDREREVLQLLAEGKTSGEMAVALSISAYTVDVHRRNIMQKLDLHTVAELTKYAVREGITSA
ncbi:MAG: response regulator transcription factor [Tepidisphaeraceae bacterium]|jgi:DNA-binding NarL/FixJ family response regulator